jgi:hypothetical protein
VSLLRSGLWCNGTHFSTTAASVPVDAATPGEVDDEGTMRQVAAQALATGGFVPIPKNPNRSGGGGSDQKDTEMSVANPIATGVETTERAMVGPAPALNEHARAVLREAGVSDEDFQALQVFGAFGPVVAPAKGNRTTTLGGSRTTTLGGSRTTTRSERSKL